MARKSLLSAALPAALPATAEANENAISAAPVPPAPIEASSPRRGSNAGKYHLGGYFDPQDPTAEAFRILAAKTRRRQQDLLAEAIADLVAKYRAQDSFSA